MNLRAILKRLFRHTNQFDEVPKLSLEAPIDAALSLYGEPCERETEKDFPEAMRYGFFVTDRIDVRLWEWRGAVHSITFWARRWENPSDDLQFILDAYDGGLGWDILEDGYLYRRKDEQIYMHCSGMPWIGVKTASYSDANAEYRKRHNT